MHLFITVCCWSCLNKISYVAFGWFCSFFSIHFCVNMTSMLLPAPLYSLMSVFCICSGRKAFISYQLMRLILSLNKARLTLFCTRSVTWSFCWDDIAVLGIFYFLLPPFSYDGHIFSWFNDQGRQVCLSSHLLPSLDFPCANQLLKSRCFGVHAKPHPSNAHANSPCSWRLSSHTWYIVNARWRYLPRLHLPWGVVQYICQSYVNFFLKFAHHMRMEGVHRLHPDVPLWPLSIRE